eukprot:gi/632938352/ref/XP_007904636.1/ PREDICTED: protein FAM63B isoform X2 [Callorhinchus milii]
MEKNENVERGGAALEAPGAVRSDDIIIIDGGGGERPRRGAGGGGDDDNDDDVDRWQLKGTGVVAANSCGPESGSSAPGAGDAERSPGGGVAVGESAMQGLGPGPAAVVVAAAALDSSLPRATRADEGCCFEAPKCEKDPSASDQSLPGESQSLDSLESFSNLNSCPSSDLTSEGPEDRAPAPAPALPGEDSGDKAKPSSSKDRFPGQSVYHIKWIKWKAENTPVITQNENGPCPLLAIMNVLLLARKIKLPPMMEIITAEQLMEYLGDYILDAKPKEITDAQRLNYEQNMSDAMAILHKLQTGLDVNVKFTGVRVFEYTPECIVFDLLDIALYHGWLVDPQNADIAKAVGMCSYNQLVEKIIFCKQSENSELVSEAFVAEQFLNSTATQLTYHGLCELMSGVQEGELCVFFRNNHFSTMTKHKDQLYLLVTDQGFLTEEKVVWESLHNVDGDGNFCDSEFHLRPPSDPEAGYKGQQDQIDQQEQQSQDMSWEQIPEGISDLELAKKLQEEEDRRASQFYQEQEQAASAQTQQGQQSQAAAAATTTGRQPGSSERKQRKEPREKEKDKCILL